jgi:hypothetical protein
MTTIVLTSREADPISPGLDPEYRRRRDLRAARRREVEQMIGFHDDAPIGGPPSWYGVLPAVDPVLYEQGTVTRMVRP